MINSMAAKDLTLILGEKESNRIIHLARRVAREDRVWQAKLRHEIERITREILANAERTGRLAFSGVEFEDFFMQHSRSVMREAIDSTQSPTIVRLTGKGNPPAAATPRSLRELRIWWDKWRKANKVPPRPESMAGRLRQAYMDNLQNVWKDAGRDFREGKTGSKEEATSAIIRGADIAYVRGRMIVETETTYYYNKTRRNIYDESNDVTHYLFMAIRDHRTTKWCKSRHGLVYAKSDPIFELETPPIHWNCRSDIVPLTADNPRHLALIQDKSRWRRNNKCEPLPTEWGGRNRA